MDLGDIYKADTIHDWGKGQCARVEDAVEKSIVLKYIYDIGLGLSNYIKPGNVLYNDIENTFTEWVYTKSKRTMINDDNTLDLSDPNNILIDFKGKRDTDGCNTTRIIMAGSTTVQNSPEQFEGIGKQIFKFFGADDANCQLHIIIDSNSGKLNSKIYVPTRATDYDKVRININALNIADSAGTRVTSQNILYQFFPFDDNSDPDVGGRYNLTNWYLANKELETYNMSINAYYTNDVPNQPHVWANLPFHVNDTNGKGAYHILMRVYITYNNGTNFINTKEWESSFVQQGSKNIQTTQGASIATLAGLIKQIDEDKLTITMVKGTGREFDLSPILNGMREWLRTTTIPDLKVIKRVLVSFIFDYKRSGDHEQVNSCKKMIDTYQSKSDPPLKYVLSTGDQLCALWARLKGVPCIYHHAHFMDLYSFHEDKLIDRLTLFDKLLKNASKLYTENKKMLLVGLDVFAIVNGHVLPDDPKYNNLESVIKYRAYLEYIITEMVKYDIRLQDYYQDLIDQCVGKHEKITEWIIYPNLETTPPDDLKTVLENRLLIVPPDIFASFIAEIKKKYAKCGGLDHSGWLASIDRNQDKPDIFGFTLGNHVTLRNKYNNLKNAHTEYRKYISLTWNSNFKQDKEGDVSRSENYKKVRSLTDDSAEMIAARTDNVKREPWFNDVKDRYNRRTTAFLAKYGNVLFDEIFVGKIVSNADLVEEPGLIAKIRDMNLLFKIPEIKGDPPEVPQLDTPVWYIRSNCNNTGGRYYGISDITIFLEDTDEKIRINNVKNGQKENLEREEFYNFTQATQVPLVSKWLMGGTAQGGGGNYEHTLTHLSAPKFIDYIERIRSNIISDLNLECVGDEVDGTMFKNYIIHSVNDIYLKYNQTDYAPDDVYNLLVKISTHYSESSNTSDEYGYAAQIYKYSIILYDVVLERKESLISENDENDEMDQDENGMSSAAGGGKMEEAHKQLHNAETRAAVRQSERRTAHNKERNKVREGKANKGRGLEEDWSNHIPVNKGDFYPFLSKYLYDDKQLDRNETYSHPIETEITVDNIIGVDISAITAAAYLNILENGLNESCRMTRSGQIYNRRMSTRPAVGSRKSTRPAIGSRSSVRTSAVGSRMSIQYLHNHGRVKLLGNPYDSTSEEGGTNNNYKTKNKLYTRKNNRKFNRKQTRKFNRKQTRKMRKQTRKINRKHTRINKINNTRKMRKQTRKHRSRR